MNQSAFIGGALLAGFVLYLAANNRLQTYAAVLWGATNSALPTEAAGATGVSGSTHGGGSVTDVIGSVADVLPYVLAAGL